ncbi:hypothetical protein BKA82DRAFT_138116 [Pisolithus tinctorius]|uniref:J domain-containing protein n=1 Tax=Pisolithus tinctorius Marx 270 TaxID=870435 RepID=A0A0C3PFU3_PISTI|nr:hypothetical protein BKA82DRAFT_138116 [Pisolithus tinctorius]KIO06794.1 hypothetical protein M404DRAFT_138116 [Pisolithus tinctorius Marx 270]
MRFSQCISALLLLVPPLVQANQSGGLAHPNLQPLVTRGDTFLSAGHWSDAAKTYSDAISLSPGDYLLFYKRATAYLSSNRHANALEDFSKVLELTSGEFDRAILMIAKIHMKDGDWTQAQRTLDTYAAKASDSDSVVAELRADIKDAQAAAKKAKDARRAQLWTVCSEAATQALRVASHSTELRQTKAECSLAGGDPQGAVVDLSRLSHLSPPTSASLMRIFRLAYFLLPPSPSSSHTSHLPPLKQCLYLDPDSPQCLAAHRLAKSLDKGFATLDKLLQKEDWMGVVKHIVGPAGMYPSDGFAATFERALDQQATPEHLAPPSKPSKASSISIPDARTESPRRAHILRAACRAYTHLNLVKKGEAWCDALLAMSAEAHRMAGEMYAGGEGGPEVDGWVGKGEALLAKEMWEEAVRAFERAVEGSGRRDRDVLNRLQKAQRLLKQSKTKDYYKVLDVPRDADTKTIKKAFRKAAMTAHPDKGGSEAKMAAVNEAYEVLSNPELRQRFDNGDDPNDTGSQGGSPFAGSHFAGFGGFGGHGSGGGGADHPFAQFFQQAGQRGFSFGRG